jgi:hypothetical protein
MSGLRRPTSGRPALARLVRYPVGHAPSGHGGDHPPQGLALLPLVPKVSEPRSARGDMRPPPCPMPRGILGASHAGRCMRRQGGADGLGLGMVVGA